MMVKHVLVATDGSETAWKAVEMATNIARACGARVTILHVIVNGLRAEEASQLARAEHIVRRVSPITMPGQERALFSMGALLQNSQGDIGKAMSALGERIVEDAAEHARTLGVDDVHTRIEPGDYSGTILAVSDEIGADMIVVGSRGLGRLAGMLLGSVSMKVAQQAACSVMIVR
ncbi:universal stress protein [Sinorhizobium sp. A49]|uniref:universal stress protein n=1 Tax=Sinorhizobium sp. A49 TaxID=1945861 RepID=UPI001FD9E9BB|nr:universal stress protein [Sinorhizobium sp. A49]